MTTSTRLFRWAILTLAALAYPDVAPAQSAPAEATPVFLADRGPGVPTAMFGTYVRKRELLLYPFAEGYFDDNYEYKPEAFGVPGEVDCRGRYRAREALFMLAYGLTDARSSSATPKWWCRITRTRSYAARSR